MTEVNIELRLALIEAMLANMATVPASEHDRRVTDLLRANNEEVQARRKWQHSAQVFYERNGTLEQVILRLIRKLEQLMRNSEGVAGLSMGDEVVTWDALGTGGPHSHWLGDEIQMALDVVNGKREIANG